jgi:hypothetical protein
MDPDRLAARGGFKALALRLSHFTCLNVVAHASFGQMKLSLLLTLNACHGAVGSLHLRVSVQGYLDGKTPRPLASKNLNAGHRLTTRPLPNSVKALFPEIAVG